MKVCNSVICPVAAGEIAIHQTQGPRAIAIPTPTIASGALEVQRAVDAEHVLWHFETPSFARGITLETGVNLIPHARTEANCTNEDCWDLL